MANTPASRAAIRRDLDKLQKWAHSHIMKFNREKCEVLHMGKNKPRHQYALAATQLGSNVAEKGPGDPGGDQVEHEPAMGPCGQEGCWYPGLH